MIPAWLTVAEAWLIAMALGRPEVDIDGCYQRYFEALGEVALLLDVKVDFAIDDGLREQLDALARRSIW